MSKDEFVMHESAEMTASNIVNQVRYLQRMVEEYETERDEARRLVKGWEEMARDGMVFDVDAVIKQRDDLQLKLQEARKLAEEWRDCACLIHKEGGFWCRPTWPGGLPWEEK